MSSRSPGRGEKMWKHSVVAGDVGWMLGRFAEINRKAPARTGLRFPFIVIQEAGSAASGSTADCRLTGLKATASIRRRLQPRRRPAKTDKIDGEALVRALLAYTLGWPPGADARHLKMQISRKLDRLELLLDQIRAVEVERDAMFAAAQNISPDPAMLLKTERYRARVYRWLVVGGTFPPIR